MMTKATFEQKFGRVLVAAILVFTALIMIHIWNDLLGEHDAWMWSCHTMGNHTCGPDSPIIRFGTDKEN